MKASTIYLELVSKDTYGVKMIPFSSIKLKVIVIPLMMFSVIPRISSLAVFLGSCFPLFDYGSEDKENFIFGIRFGLIPLIFILSIYVLLSLVYWCFHVKKQKQMNKSEYVLGYFSNMIAPSIITHQTSGLILHGSIFTISTLSVMTITMLITLNIDPKIWNSSIGFEGKYQFCITILAE